MTQIALYRIYRADGDFLYVGTTNSTKTRWNQHAKDKPWWHEAEYIDFRWFPSHWVAPWLEAVTIIEECPRYNRMMPPGPPRPGAHPLDTWRRSLNEATSVAFNALAGGLDLEDVAKASGFHPRYLVRLGRQRSVPWAVNYRGVYDDLPEAGYLWPGWLQSGKQQRTGP